MSLPFLICSWLLVFSVLHDHGSSGFLEVNLNLSSNSSSGGSGRTNYQNNQISPSPGEELEEALLQDAEKEFRMIPPSPPPTQFPDPRSRSIEIQCTEMKSSKLGEGQIMATEMCPAKIKHMIGKSVTDLRCQPRPEIVKLQLPGPNFDLHPSVAEVKRCNGFCGTPTSCLPTRTSIKQVPVFIIDKARLHMFAQECAMVELEEHEECRCTCAVKASHCGLNQKYERGNCACVCMNHEAREECERNFEKGVLRQWDPTSCTCRSVQESVECASGLMWVVPSSRTSSLALTTPQPTVHVNSTNTTLPTTRPRQNSTIRTNMSSPTSARPP